jgi:hypothetical protein
MTAVSLATEASSKGDAMHQPVHIERRETTDRDTGRGAAALHNGRGATRNLIVHSRLLRLRTPKKRSFDTFLTAGRVLLMRR